MMDKIALILIKYCFIKKVVMNCDDLQINLYVLITFYFKLMKKNKVALNRIIIYYVINYLSF